MVNSGIFKEQNFKSLVTSFLTSIINEEVFFSQKDKIAKKFWKNFRKLTH